MCSEKLIAIKFEALVLFITVISSSNVSADSRQSLDFLLPNAFDALGAKCLKLRSVPLLPQIRKVGAGF